MVLKIRSTPKMGFDERWCEYKGGIKFKVASIARDQYQIGLGRARRILERKESGLDLYSLGVDAQDRTENDIQAELLGHFIIQDWEGDIQDSKGNQINYSPEMAAELLRSEPSLISWVLMQAVEIKLDLDKEQEDIVGKSSSATSGKKTGQAKVKNVH